MGRARERHGPGLLEAQDVHAGRARRIHDLMHAAHQRLRASTGPCMCRGLASAPARAWPPKNYCTVRAGSLRCNDQKVERMQILANTRTTIGLDPSPLQSKQFVVSASGLYLGLLRKGCRCGRDDGVLHQAYAHVAALPQLLRRRPECIALQPEVGTLQCLHSTDSFAALITIR